ncbi:MAG: efflux RND transporter periplasmic adaptor subunit [Patescibacteria group bacterium]|nr:efflux RND transporter periplasmic adaptor subunit [Patescibacteria group bacterium]
MPTFLKSKWTIGILVLLMGGGYWFFLRNNSSSLQFVTVTKSSITETVSATGNTTPLKSVSLAFQGSGTIARVYYNLGDEVRAGAVIAELNAASLSAALEEAQANLAVAQANLAGITAGTRPEQLAIDQSSVAQNKAALVNAIASAYIASDTAVHTDADQIFTSPRTTSATLTIIVPDATLANQVVQERITLESMFVEWNTEVTALSSGSNDLVVAGEHATQNLTQISTFLNNVAAALTKTQPSTNVSAATLSSYESSVASARTSIASALSTLTSAETALVGAQGTLTLAQAGPTPQDIAAQQAQVAQAQAGVTSARANLQNTELIAPISGILTEQDAKVGQQASPATPLVSIIGNSGFEVDTGVSDTDVGKLSVGDPATITLGAFPNETFAGTVFYIAPAETNTQGVISYQVKISFDKSDPRLKSGLIANIDIRTKQHDNVLILPQYAILQNDSGTFVETLVGKAATTTPVTLGIANQNGDVEVLSGVSEGERVVNIGLKK